MKKVFFLLVAFCLVSSLAFAANPVVTTTTNVADTTTSATVSVVAPVDAAAPVAMDKTVITPATTDTTAVITPAAVAKPEVMALSGVIIDNMCAKTNKDTLAEFVKTHTKECALMPGCMASGYSIFADGKLWALDQDSSVKVAEFLKQADNEMQVIITAKQVGDELNLITIENQN
jgi:hypothetical protein